MDRKKAIEDRFAKWQVRVNKLVGHLFWVPVQESHHIYAHLLADWSFAFYDDLTRESDPDFAVLTAQPVLFRTHVMGLVFTQRAHKWKDVGAWPIPEHLQKPAVYCRSSIKNRDPETQAVVYDYYRAVADELVPINREECEALEKAATWHPLHISERLRQHYQLVQPPIDTSNS